MQVTVSSFRRLWKFILANLRPSCLIVFLSHTLRPQLAATFQGKYCSLPMAGKGSRGTLRGPFLDFQTL